MCARKNGKHFSDIYTDIIITSISIILVTDRRISCNEDQDKSFLINGLELSIYGFTVSKPKTLYLGSSLLVH